MFNLDDSYKMHGDRYISTQDGKTYRNIDGQAANGNPVKRDLQITVLATTEFTYRTYPNAEDTSIYYDIVHEVTDHAEPANYFFLYIYCVKKKTILSCKKNELT